MVVIICWRVTPRSRQAPKLFQAQELENKTVLAFVYQGRKRVYHDFEIVKQSSHFVE
jgi:hypothetical protein